MDILIYNIQDLAPKHIGVYSPGGSHLTPPAPGAPPAVYSPGARPRPVLASTPVLRVLVLVVEAERAASI